MTSQCTCTLVLSVQTVEEHTSYDSETGERTTTISRVADGEKRTTVIRSDENGIEKFENVEKLTSDVISPHLQRIEQTPPSEEEQNPGSCDFAASDVLPSFSAAASGSLLSRVKESFGLNKGSQSQKNLSEAEPPLLAPMRERFKAWKPNIMAKLFPPKREAPNDD